MEKKTPKSFSTIGERGLQATYVTIDSKDSQRCIEQAFSILFDAIIENEK